MERNLEEIVHITQISYYKNWTIGESGNTVFMGTFNNEKVAVKRIGLKNRHLETSEDNLKNLIQNPHIVRLYHAESHEDFRYNIRNHFLN